MTEFRLALLIVLLACAGNLNAVVTVRSEPSVTPTQTQWRVDVGRAYDNPFDPEQVAVEGRFTGPGGKTLVVPAFWRTPSDSNDGSFCLRFTPPVPGRWTLTVASTDTTGTAISEAVAFEPAKASPRGFVRRSTKNPRYFQFDNGEPYFLTGLNVAWGENKSFASYEKWLPQLAAGGGNFARVWMSDPSVMTETKEAGLGRYDQAACAFYDRLFALAEANGIYCMVTFNNYRDLREHDNWGPCPWPLLPYAAANGGPATRPADFITDPRCRKVYRDRLRYIAARYGAFASVMCWEFFNEQTFAEVPIPASWTIEMARHLKGVDAYQHLVSTSFGGAAQGEVWRAPEIDLTQTHYYGDDQTADCTPVVRAAALEHRAFDKPYLMAELGIWAMGSDAKFDPAGLGTNLHNGLWSALMSGSAGTAANWWWDSYVGPNDLWHAYAGVAAFAKAIDLVDRDFRPVIVAAALYREPAPETFGDSELNAAGGWGRSHGQTIVVEPNGRSERALAKYIFGSGHADLQTPTVIDATFAPGGGELVVKVGQVSDAAILRVLIDGEPTRDFLLSALPKADHVASTTRATRDEKDDAHRIYQAKLDGATFAVPVPAGRHRLELRNLGADWLALSSATLHNTRSSRYAELEVLAMADDRSGEVIAWLHDPDSNWKADATGRTPHVVAPAIVRVPVSIPDGTAVALEWWDTRTGRIASTGLGRVNGGMLEVETPPITRDIALIARRAAVASR